MVAIRRLMVSFGFSLLLLCGAVAVGLVQGKYAATASVVMTSVVAETLVGAAASVPAGFDPWSGALLVVLANVSPVPILLTSSDALVSKWRWLHRKVQKAEANAYKYEKYGAVGLAMFTPFIGSYIAAVAGVALRWRTAVVFGSIVLGDVVAALVTTAGGQWIAHVL